VQHKVEPPKPTPVAVAVPTTEPTALTTAPAAAPAAAPADPGPATGTGGATGGTGSGGGDGGGGEVDMGPWMREMQRRIKKSWFPPKGNESKRIKVTFKVSKDGSAHKVKLLSSSGVSIADDAAIQAISDASPFAPLPDGVGDEIDINFTFDYNVFGAKH
jgi:TonB family protein